MTMPDYNVQGTIFSITDRERVVFCLNLTENKEIHWIACSFLVGKQRMFKTQQNKRQIWQKIRKWIVFERMISVFINMFEFIGYWK